jgi:hypothetical protein
VLTFSFNPVQSCDGEEIEYDGDGVDANGEPETVMGCKCHQVLSEHEDDLDKIKGVRVIVEPVAGG